MDKTIRRTIEVEANVRKGCLFIEGFDEPIYNKSLVSKLKNGNTRVQIKPDGFFFFDNKDGGTVLSCHVIYEDRSVATVYYFVNQRKFKLNCDSAIFETVSSDLDYVAAIFDEYPYKYGKKVDRVDKFYQNPIDDMEFYASKDPSVEYKYARNLFEVMEHFDFNMLEYSRMINSTNNIFIKAYANARKRCNKGRINADLMKLADLKYTEPYCFDYLIELYKLENRLRYHGIEIPKNQKVSGLSDLRLSIEGFKDKIHYIADVMTKAVKYMKDSISTIQKMEEEGE